MFLCTNAQNLVSDSRTRNFEYLKLSSVRSRCSDCREAGEACRFPAVNFPLASLETNDSWGMHACAASTALHLSLWPPSKDIYRRYACYWSNWTLGHVSRYCCHEGVLNGGALCSAAKVEFCIRAWALFLCCISNATFVQCIVITITGW
jgi:hypothetical protein